MKFDYFKKFLNESTQERWGVWCIVSGGMTGHRASWLKENGKLKIFNSEKEAEKEAKKLNSERSMGGAARFSYTAAEMNGI